MTTEATDARADGAGAAEGAGEAGEVVGLLLAAGGGRRLGGRPKALLEHRGRPLVEHAVRVLREAGCERIHVVLGASADIVRARASLPGCVLVDNPDWEQGMGSSLRAGLDSLRETEAGTATDTGTVTDAATGTATAATAGAALVSLVDQPGISPAAIARVRAAYRSPMTLAAASYEGRRGHPVLFGSGHWAGIAARAVGDRGARDYLREHAAKIVLVPCGDIAEEYDIDTAEDLVRLEPAPGISPSDTPDAPAHVE
ncbi:nucleotidyltransferase family protein [Streptomyces sp. NPDC005865]|uniref:nucleotidyltransferase family protein n=1 Tax=Streptomyces sp. NPDC005865 TaxID=3155453 RepID=UPI0033F56742